MKSEFQKANGLPRGDTASPDYQRRMTNIMTTLQQLALLYLFGPGRLQTPQHTVDILSDSKRIVMRAENKATEYFADKKEGQQND